MMPRKFTLIALLIVSICLVFTPTQVNAKDTDSAETLRRLDGEDDAPSTPPPVPKHPPVHKPSGGGSATASSSSSGGGGGSSGGRSSGGGSHVAAHAAHSPAKKNALMLVGAATMAGAAIAAAAYRNRQRQVVVESHPLEGALSKRMEVFNNLAGKAGKNAARPERVVKVDGVAESSTSYAVMSDSGIAVV